jgi:16S rRNA (guanine966-N2)-methyltransferase
MRIIAGQRRGQRIDGPIGRALRPTSDMVREAIFNILREDIEGRPVLDLFAGTGALGLEALSRGASHATFIERDRGHAALIRRNLAALRYESRGSVLATDAYRWVRTYQALDEEPVAAFVDPPYDDYEAHPRRIQGLLSELITKLPPGSLLIVESGRPLGADVLDDPEAWDHRRYGSTCLAIRTLDPGLNQDRPDPPSAEARDGSDLE